MKYEKPEVIVLASACAGIQSTTKVASSIDGSNRPSVTAYEADE
jgi:hypothetical protein